ncbi:hypothetical protein HPB49_006865 [Dermacentor silvarum]|uniref:Uncharacterized protein n=1 Tax=Dermacentor silvarum TaxID=543639 RepID=A0ACB8DWR4_DERSI|nr:hypothetical protein HPB49_006865 [Dermacentor silvarum]
MRAARLGAVAAAPAPAQSPGHPPLSVRSDTPLRRHLFTPTFLPGGPLIIHHIAHHVHRRRLLIGATKQCRCRTTCTDSALARAQLLAAARNVSTSEASLLSPKRKKARLRATVVLAVNNRKAPIGWSPHVLGDGFSQSLGSLPGKGCRPLFACEDRTAFTLQNSMIEEQRDVIRFLTAEGGKPATIHRRMVTVYREDCVSDKSMRKWRARFRAGRYSLVDDPRPGQANTVITADLIDKVDDL